MGYNGVAVRLTAADMSLYAKYRYPASMVEFPTIQIRVAGVSFDNRDGSSRQAYIRLVKKGDGLVLRREPDNFFDPNAMAVDWTDAQGHPCQLGYVPRSLAALLAPLVDKGVVLKAEVARKGGGGRLRGVRMAIDLVAETVSKGQATGLEPAITEALEADRLEMLGETGFAPALGGTRAS
jgi:HIRAN domain